MRHMGPLATIQVSLQTITCSVMTSGDVQEENTSGAYQHSDSCLRDCMPFCSAHTFDKRRRVQVLGPCSLRHRNDSATPPSAQKATVGQTLVDSNRWRAQVTGRNRSREGDPPARNKAPARAVTGKDATRRDQFERFTADGKENFPSLGTCSCYWTATACATVYAQTQVQAIFRKLTILETCNLFTSLNFQELSTVHNGK